MSLKRVSGAATFLSRDKEKVTQPPPKPTRPAPSLPYGAGKYKRTEASAAAPPPPAPPRQITRSVTLRSWWEPSVRFWWLATIVMIFIGACFLFSQLSSYFEESELIQHGIAVTGTIVSAGDEHDSRVSRQFPPDAPVDLQFTVNGQSITESGVILTVINDSDFIHPGQTVALHVDPKDPTNWTDRKEPEVLARRLVAGSVMVPVILATLLASLFLRRRVLRTWQNAEAHEYAVVSSSRSALAPLSFLVRCEPLGVGRDQRLVTVYLPARFARPAAGDVLWLMHPPGKPQASIAAAAYE
jgi:hypothetical protein